MLCEGHCRIGLKSIYGKMAVAEVGSQVVRSSDRVRAPGQPVNVRSTFNASPHHHAPCRFARCPRSHTPGHRPQLCCTLNIEPRLQSQSQLYSSDIFGQQIALTTPSGSTSGFLQRHWLASANPPLVGLRNADLDGLTRDGL